MCKVEMLRALLNARLSAAVEEIFAVFERTIAEYEAELCRTKEENERQRRLLDAVFMPHADPHRPGASEEYVPPKLQVPESPRDKQENMPALVLVKEEENPEMLHVKEEDEEADIFKFPFPGIPLKSENEGAGRRGEARRAEPPTSSSSQRVAVEGAGDRRGGSQAESLLAPLSDSDEITSQSSGTDADDEHSKGDRTGHADNKRVKCSQCDNTFFNKSSLKRHITTHTGEKPFACSVCGKRFRIKGDLRIHTRIHTGERPFACSICGKGFTQKGHLRSHIRTHTGEKPFACSFCNLSFSQRSSLVPHMRTHTGEKPYSCSVCGKSFSLHVNLVRHRRTHAGEKVVSCSMCEEHFSSESERNKHVCADEK
ncbi:zinc finger protein 771-like [Hippocampus zosterae]|uniref:zinc finger protein 771-like n=1 Tax=Hippocampus zosterae TaxID=109293 RepID=UPI00223CF273|nr:zinc finger protein 771-like [Hippocampus zosterae]